MSYLEQPQMSNRKIIALALALLVHALLGYAFVTGLAVDFAKKVFQPLETVNIEEEVEEEPPPPPEEIPDITVVTPPPDVTVDVPPPPTAIKTETTVVVPTPTPAPVLAPAPEPVAAPPPPPPAPPAVASAAKLKGNRTRLISNDDYPDAAARAEEQGTTSVSFEVSEQGRVENCVVTQSSGSRRLDETTCTLITRRFRFDPAKDTSGNPIREKKTDKVKWVLPTG